MAAKIFRINYKSDFILTMNSEAGWTIPFCIKFWTSIPMRAYYVGFDGTTYTHCAYDPAEPTKLLVQFDDHHLPIGNLHFQIAYHFTVEDFPNNTEDEVFNATAITTEIDGETYQVMLDFTGETAPGIDFNMPSVGVTSVNGKIGAVTLNAQDVGAQPTIEDLATIRSGAAAGATAVQPAALQQGLATKQDTISDLATIRSGAAAGATAVQPAGLQEGLATKQDTIADLSTIRSGAAAGATAVQPAGLTPIESALQTIEAVIPSAASSQNQLADKNFVNSSIVTNTANFVGTYNSLAELQAVQNPTNNDYGFVIETDAQGNEYYDRYKYVAASQQWLFEYKVESTPFTAEQWAAIQSGITSALVTKLNALPTAQQLSTQLNGKQDVIVNSEDIAKSNTQLFLADRAYVATTSSVQGNMGYKILRKGSTFASQVTATNTIYEIRYDFDLNNATVTIPTGCVLKFNGGSLQNGTVAGQGAEVIGCKGCFSNISINGIASELHSVWFKDDLQDCLGNIVDSTIVIDHGAYTFTKQVNLRQGVIIKSDNAKISTSYPIYIGYRVEIYDVEIVSSGAHALVIDNVWVKNSRTSDYIAKHGIDENRVGAIVKHCNLSCSSYNNTSSIYIVLNAGGVNMNDIHIDSNVFKKAEIGVECFNNVSMTEEIKPWSTQHYISDNSFQLCLNAIKYHRLSELQDYIVESKSFSGINITGNASQYRNVVEGGVTYSTNYFVYAEGVQYLSCKNNLPWDFGATSQYKLCIYDQLFVTIDDTFDAAVEYFGMNDLLSLVSSNKDVCPSDVCNESHFWTTLPSPINGSNYTVLDFLALDNERGYQVNKNSTFYTQLGFVSAKEGILRKHRIGRYQMDIEIVFPTLGNNPSTTYNANPLIYRGSFYIRLSDIKANIQTAIADVFLPVQFINTKYQDPAYLTKGSIFFSGPTGGVKAVNRTGGISNIALLSSGTTAQRPSSPFSAGFTYFDTTLGKMIVWNGTAWVNMDGTALS